MSPGRRTRRGPWRLVRRGLPNVRARVTVAATLAALVVAGAGALLFVSLLNRALEQALLASIDQQAASISAQLQAGSTPAQTVAGGGHDLVLQLVGAQGQILASDHPGLTRPLRTSVGTSQEVRDSALEDSYSVVARTGPGGVLVVVGQSEDQVDRATATAAGLLSIAVPIGLALLAAAVWVSVGRGLRPVEAIRREAAAITSEDLGRRLPVPPGSDEIARLADTLNKMLDRIDAAQKRQRQFVSDASHELRSPLATMRQLAEVARRHPDQVATGQLADDVLLEEQRMEELVTALLMLARLDDGQRGALNAVDLDDLVLQEVRRHRGHDGPHIDTAAVGAGQVRSSPVLLAQVVRNLLSNAVRHADHEVRVSLVEADGLVTLVVQDDGNGVPADQRQAIFERFVRLDESRTRDEGGSGLGLAIVQKVVDGMGGSIRVDDAPGGGARFSVVLPAVLI